MSSDPFKGGEFFPDDLLAVANVITERITYADTEIRQILAELSGSEFVELSDEAQRANEVRRTALMLRWLEDPDFAPTTAEAIELTTSDQEFEELTAHHNTTNPLGHTLTEEDTRRAFAEFADKSDELSDYSASDRAKDFASQVKAAKEIAEEQGVQLVEVYEDDDLFYEIARRTTTPVELAKKHVDIMNSFSAEILQTVLFNLLDEPFRKELEGLSPEEIESSLLELQLDEELTAVIESIVETSREASRQLFVHRAVMRWGSEALEFLALDELSQLRPKQQLVSLVQATVDKAE